MDKASKTRKGRSRPSGRRNLPLMLLQAREVMLQHFRPIFQRFGITEQQWRIMRLLSDHDRLEQREISSACQISGPSLSNILSRLQEIGYVARVRSRDDNRKVFVSLAERGWSVIEEVRPSVDERYRDLEKAVGPELMNSLVVVLDKLLALPLSTLESGARRPRPTR